MTSITEKIVALKQAVLDKTTAATKQSQKITELTDQLGVAEQELAALRISSGDDEAAIAEKEDEISDLKALLNDATQQVNILDQKLEELNDAFA